MTKAEREMIAEFFIKVVGNQALMMLGLSYLVDYPKLKDLLHEHAMKMTKENSEAIDFLRKG